MSATTALQTRWEHTLVKMWRGSLLLNLALGLMCLSVLARRVNSNVIEPNCEKYPLPLCTREYSPVCGTDGKTYATECMLCLSNSEDNANVLIKHRSQC